MYVFPLFFFLTLFISLNVNACPTLAEAHSQYLGGHSTEAIATLECLLKAEPNNADAQRFLIDIYWWEAQTRPAESHARSLLANDQVQRDHELLSHLTSIADHFHLSANLDYFSGSSASGTQTGTEERAELDYRDLRKNHYSVGYSRLGRVFSGGPQLIDNDFSAGFVTLLSSSNYLETRAGYSSTALFSPVWFAGFEPHLVFKDETDISIGYQFNNYTGLNTSLVTASALRPVADRLSFGAKVYTLFTTHVFLSVQGSLKWMMTSRTFLRGFVAGGQTLEAPGLEDTFSSAGGEFGFRVLPDFILRADFSTYNAAIRGENRAGLGVDWLF